MDPRGNTSFCALLDRSWLPCDFLVARITLNNFPFPLTIEKGNEKVASERVI